LKFIEAKIFKTSNNNFCYKEYDSKTIDYFKFIALQKEQNLIQFIITSDIMIDVMMSLVTEKGYKLVSVEMMNDDTDLNSEINILVKSIEEDGKKLAILINKLQILSDSQSIDIRSIKLKKRENAESIQIKLQSNGIFSINNEKFYDKSDQLLALIVESYVGNNEEGI